MDYFYINPFRFGLNWIQWLQLENLRVLFYEAKLTFSDRYIAIQKCHQAIELLRNLYKTLALSKDVHNFIFAQGAQKLPAFKV